MRRTAAPDDARRLAAQAVRDGFATIIAAGGDGTANEVVNGMADVPGGLAAARLGILPLGTINVFARELGLPRKLPAAVQVLAAGHELTMDLGCVEFGGVGGPRRRYFLQLAGAGMDARAVQLVNWAWKKKSGKLAYVLACLRALREPHPVISVEGPNPMSGQLVLVGNGRFYAGSHEIFPGADLRDGLLEFRVLSKVSAGSALRGALGLATGRVTRFLPMSHCRSATLTLRSSSRVAFQLDGEYAGELPAAFSVLRQAVRVIVP